MLAREVEGGVASKEKITYICNQMKQYTLIIIILTTLLAGCGYRQTNERIDSLYVQGDRYLNNNQWDSAMIVFSEAERLLNPQTDLVMRGRVYAALGYLWKSNNNIPKAIEYKKKAWQAYDKAGDEDLSVLTLLKISDYHSNYKTLEGHRKALEYIERTNAYQNINDTTRGNILQNKAFVYFFANQWDSAIVYFHKAQAYPMRSSTHCINRLYLGISHFNLNQLDSAKHCVTEALTYPAKLQQRSGCYNILHRIANAEGDSAAINHYAAILITYKDSMMRKENKLSYQATAMDDKVDVLQDKKHRHQMIIIAIALALVVIVALAVYCLRTKYHQKQKEEWSLGLDEAENRAKQAEKTLQEEQLAHQQMLSEKKNQRIQELQATYPPTGHHWSEEQWEQISHDMKLHGDLFLTRLNEQHPNLSKEEVRLCVLIILNHSHAEIANSLSLSTSYIPTKKQRMATKIGVSSAQLREYLLHLYN